MNPPSHQTFVHRFPDDLTVYVPHLCAGHQPAAQSGPSPPQPRHRFGVRHPFATIVRHVSPTITCTRAVPDSAARWMNSAPHHELCRNISADRVAAPPRVATARAIAATNFRLSQLGQDNAAGQWNAARCAKTPLSERLLHTFASFDSASVTLNGPGRLIA